MNLDEKTIKESVVIEKHDEKAAENRLKAYADKMKASLERKENSK